MEELRNGLLVDNRYQLKEYKGRGSFGEVWLAHDNQTNIDLAIKIYVALDQKGCDEFLSEYKMASGLQDRNLLRTYDYGVWDSRPYITMEYCARGATSNMIGTLSPSQYNELTLWRFLRDVAGGLAYLHRLSPNPIVHQDIKPDNILINDDGNFIITDFGISKRVRNTMTAQSKRAESSGSVPYMAPERFSSNPAPILSSDMWSLGASVYELAEGELPFSGMGGVMLKNGADMAVMSDGWSQGLKDIVAFCLAKESWDRAKADEVCRIAQAMIDNNLSYNATADINRIMSERKSGRKQDPVKTKKTKNDQQPTAKQRRSPLIWVVIVLALAVGGVIYFFATGDTRAAKKNLTEYNFLVETTSKEIDALTSARPQEMLNMRQKVAQVEAYDKIYHDVLPNDYCQAEQLSYSLNQKMYEASVDWAKAADGQAYTLEDYDRAVQYYQISLQLHEDANVRARMEHAKEKMY